MNSTPESSYGIGTVARLTGLTTHTIRAWENRYSAVAVTRDAAGRRRYSAEDVDRLVMLKKLVDWGERIGAIAGLSAQDLAERLADTETRATGRPTRVLVAGDTADEVVNALSIQRGAYEIVDVRDETDPDEIAVDPSRTDCLIFDCPSITYERVAAFRRLRRRCPELVLVLIYGFGPQEDLKALVANGVVLVRSPISVEDLLRAIQAGTAAAPKEFAHPRPSRPKPAAGKRRFSMHQLAELARISTSVQCECPRHLVTLIRSLTAFEVYSAECENRNPADAALHAHLESETARARRIMESSLQVVIDMEGIELSKGNDEKR